ncbi:MAG: hypothetical protein PHV02_10710 [Rhodocyclaceae bacterium]|nr:hypothetical protein [Rhodocyclaceae bacterium]
MSNGILRMEERIHHVQFSLRYVVTELLLIVVAKINFDRERLQLMFTGDRAWKNWNINILETEK